MCRFKHYNKQTAYLELIRKILLRAITLVILSLSGYYIIINRSDFDILKKLSIIQVGILAVLNVLLLVWNAIFSWYQYKQFNLSIGKIESFFLNTATSFGNTFLPFRSGLGIQAVYLKKVFNFKYSYFASVMTGAYIINFFIVGLLGLISVLYFFLYKNIFNIFVFTAFFLLTFGVIFSLRFSNLFLRLIFVNRIREVAKTILEGWGKFSNSFRKIFILSVIFLANIITISALMYFQFEFLQITKLNGENVSIADAIFLSTFLILSSIINITPSALGIKEIFLAYAALVVTLNPQDAIVASVLDRIVGVSVQLVLGPVSLFYLKKKNRISQE